MQTTLDALDNAVSNVHACWQLFKELFEKADSRRLLADCMGPMWDAIKDSLADSIVLQIAKLNDPPDHGKNRDNLSLRQVLLQIKPSITPAEVQNVEAKIDSLGQTSATITSHRMKRIAHADYKVATDPNAALQTIKFADVENALAEIRTIVNEIYKLAGRTQVYYEWIAMGEPGRALLTRIEMTNEFNELSRGVWAGQLDCDKIKAKIKQISR